MAALQAVTKIHHAYFLGLQLMVSTRKGPQVMGDWMFRLFRRQHEDKFLSSFSKLGLDGLPHAVACAQYHVLSNGVGGVPVEYMYENDSKAWVRFRYPRWMFAGPTICGVTTEVSRGFLEGWYAQNGVSLGNPRLGFVCVSEDMTGEFGLCGYFKEYEHELDDGERLVFAKDERPPTYDADMQPQPPADQWDEVRLAKANRNYAFEYVRNGLTQLAAIIGDDEASELGTLAARLIGLQYYAETAADMAVEDEGIVSAATYLGRMFTSLGDKVEVHEVDRGFLLNHTGLRVVRGLAQAEQDLVLRCWQNLWQGAMSARREMLTLDVVPKPSGLAWELTIK
jgi:hypothetical protein